MSEQEQELKFPAIRTGKVVVVGSLNEDLVVTAIRAPGPGETLMAAGHSTGLGGKGANQAVAARRMGAAVEMLGTLGEDPVASRFRTLFQTEGIETGLLSRDPDGYTGLAVIVVDAAGENRILVSPGVNAATTIAPSGPAIEKLAQADVVLAQLEVPAETIARAFAAAQGVRILNAAPAGPLPPELLSSVDVLVVNESELAAVTGSATEAKDLAEVAEQASRLETKPIIVVTRGAAGCVIIPPGEKPITFDAQRVEAIDTTGAGDCFCGTMAAQLALGHPLAEAVALGVRAATLSATRPGAIASLPYLSEL
ncbi:ribokinase [Arthrobacter sp. 35W]|uniref:ribokinase n=1 Tax=Arthrobacter sp. 35W TaxID=1132441 RepID=UPI0003FFC230|nr:ribokinase [Arthrobacter sp. 35W]